MAEDLQAARTFQKLHPGKITVVRYEDLSLEPELLTRRLLKFLALPWTESISRFIQTHTQSVETMESSNHFY